jgi:hypothetical protein
MLAPSNVQYFELHVDVKQQISFTEEINGIWRAVDLKKGNTIGTFTANEQILQITIDNQTIPFPMGDCLDLKDINWSIVSQVFPIRKELGSTIEITREMQGIKLYQKKGIIPEGLKIYWEEQNK